MDVKSCIASGIALGYVFPVCPVMLSELILRFSGEMIFRVKMLYLKASFS